MPDTPSSDAPVPRELSPREQLELAKLEVEIGLLNRPFWKQSAFYAAASTVLVPLLGALLAYGSGWFDLKQLELKNEKILLEADTAKLEASKASLTDQTANLEKEKSALEKDKVELMSQLGDLMRSRAEQQAQVVVATNELRVLRNQISAKEDLIDRLNEKVSALTSQNAASQAIAKQLESAEQGIKTLEQRQTELELRLAMAHEYARTLVIHAHDVLVKVEEGDVGALLLAKNELSFRVGMWRAEFERDLKNHTLGRFEREVSGIVDTNLLADLERYNERIREKHSRRERQ